MPHPESAPTPSRDARASRTEPLDRPPVSVERRSLRTTAQILRSLEVRIDLLRARGITVPRVDLAGAYARHLVTRALVLTRAPDDQTGFDAKDCAGIRYRILGHRDGAGSDRVSLPGIPHRRFDRIVVVRIGSGYGIRHAPLAPSEPFLRHARYSSHANQWSLSIDHPMWREDAVADLTELLRAAAAESVPEDEMPAIDPFRRPGPYPPGRRAPDLVPPRA